eukprot:Gregarina_sp_Pseudo_9__117@NODE_107_length_4228_cov_101_740272_g99_i0_p2_GENE_NODE_107_length_4228_cov_101_740272_g99_i0NODE_107_length_4228_cov_101_740272_g99_i0_p2_ORF_typecomplete_len466_score26_06GST_C_3/PF14497_6/0_0001GST_N_3/PF13417_6/1_8e04GST_N_3/PF13417_6/0_052_NODE_107_length_4228_cov_101_740272_g99_i027874184
MPNRDSCFFVRLWRNTGTNNTTRANDDECNDNLFPILEVGNGTTYASRALPAALAAVLFCSRGTEIAAGQIVSLGREEESVLILTIRRRLEKEKPTCRSALLQLLDQRHPGTKKERSNDASCFAFLRYPASKPIRVYLHTGTFLYSLSYFKNCSTTSTQQPFISNSVGEGREAPSCVFECSLDRVGAGDVARERSSIIQCLHNETLPANDDLTQSSTTRESETSSQQKLGSEASSFMARRPSRVTRCVLPETSSKVQLHESALPRRPAAVARLFSFDLCVMTKSARWMLEVAQLNFDSTTWSSREWKTTWKRRAPSETVPWIELDGIEYCGPLCVNEIVGELTGFVPTTFEGQHLAKMLMSFYVFSIAPESQSSPSGALWDSEQVHLYDRLEAMIQACQTHRHHAVENEYTWADFFLAAVYECSGMRDILMDDASDRWPAWTRIHDAVLALRTRRMLGHFDHPWF